MATPIKITPFLEGKDSVRFNKRLKAQKDNKISDEEKDRILKLVDIVLSKSSYTPNCCR